MNTFSTLWNDQLVRWWVGVALMFLVPAALWIVGSMISRTKHGWEAAFAFVTGAKNRLSLSRAQAFAWTLVIFGSFVAAMIVHNKICAGTLDEIKLAEDEEKSLATRIVAVSDNLNKSRADLDVKKMAVLLATTDAAKQTATTAQAEAEKAVTSFEATLKELKEKKAAVNPYRWVLIPSTLLALAGIAISSGVFSSVISAVSGETPEAEVNSVSIATIAAPPPAGVVLPGGQIAADTDKLERHIGQEVWIIRGENLGDKGKVRLINSRRSEVVFDEPLVWQDRQIVVLCQQPRTGRWSTLIVDTRDGKHCFAFDGRTLGDPKAYYELADLFCEDKDPTSYSLMKFQMFGWTVIAIGFYIWLFLSDLRPDLQSLPVVPESIVLLTGLSQAGYLGGKAVSNLPKQPSQP